MIGKLWGAALACALLFSGMAATGAHAQASRTWVSGVGDDAHPCQRTSPCKTFAGAINKTTAGGEINCLDPGGYGAVTITKSIAIICDQTMGGVITGSTGGILVKAGINDVVYLSGLDIQGLAGTTGISVQQAAAVHVVNSRIRGFGTAGISVAPNSTVIELYLVNTIITDNKGGDLLIAPTGNGAGVVAALRNVSLLNSTAFGFKVDTSGLSVGSVFATLQDSTVAGNNAAGVVANSGAGTGSALIQINHSSIAGNQQGVAAIGSTNSKIYIADSTVTGNSTGFTETMGTVTSYKNNYVDGNATLGTFVQSGPQ